MHDVIIIYLAANFFRCIKQYHYSLYIIVITIIFHSLANNA
jgi:hypothetical protein